MEKVADPARAHDGLFTYGDYRLWPEDERWELIGGVAYQMAAPSLRHQAIAGRIYVRIYNYLEGKPCRAYIAPFDVLLPEAADEDDDKVMNVVQPDVVVFCDRAKLTTAGARGAPDIAIEVLSHTTAKKDLGAKYELFERMGVREYWLIDPEGRWMHRYDRLPPEGPEGRYGEPEMRDTVRPAGPIASRVLEGFSLDPEDIFAAE